MKKIIYCLLVTCLSLTFFPLQSSAAVTEKPTSNVTKPQPVETIEVGRILKSAENMNAVDKSTLSPKDKSGQEIEVRSGYRHHRHNGGVVYMSAGGVILVVILVLILV